MPVPNLLSLALNLSLYLSFCDRGYVPATLCLEELLSITDYIKPGGGEVIILYYPRVLNFSLILTFLDGFMGSLTVDAAFLPKAMAYSGLITPYLAFPSVSN